MFPQTLTLVLAAITLGNVACVQKLQEQFRWQQMDYEYPTEQARMNALRTGRFIPANNLPVGIEVWNEKLFISVPRWRGGIPATLNYIPLHAGTPSTPRLIPYPDWPSNEVGNCEKGLTTVYRIKADECDRLWVLDTGTFGIGNTTTNPCPYAINVFDLRTNTRIRRYELRKEDTNANTFIANIAVDIGAHCDDAFAYLSDELGYGLIAYSWAENKSWRFTHGFFLPDPLAGDFNIGGLTFQWFEEGIFGMSLTPIQTDGFRTLFFAPLSSNREFAVSTRILRNSSKVDDSYADFVALDERGPKGHTTSRVMDEYGVQFFNLIDRNAVGCWNMQNPYNKAFHSIVDSDDEALSFPADVKVDRDRNLWVISDRMPNFLLASLDPNDVNFRIFFAPIDVLIKGTVCELNVDLNQYAYPQGNYQIPQHIPQQIGQQIPQQIPQHISQQIPQQIYKPLNVPQQSYKPIQVPQPSYKPIIDIQPDFNIVPQSIYRNGKLAQQIHSFPQSFKQIFGITGPQTFGRKQIADNFVPQKSYA